MDCSGINWAVGGLIIGLGLGLKAKRPLMEMARSFATQLTRDSTKMVLVVRNDLGMGKGKVASQCAHAAVQCYIEGQQNQKDIILQWTMFGQPKVVLKANSEEELNNLYHKAKTLGLICCIIQDAGRTQLASGTSTVLGVGPGHTRDVDKITSHLKLY